MNLPEYIKPSYGLLLRNLVERLRTVVKSGLLSVVLFGSVARGTCNDKSDIDVLIIYDGKAVSRRIVRNKFIASRKHVLRDMYGDACSTDIFSLPFLSSVIMELSEAKAIPYILLDIAVDGIVLFDFERVFEHIREKISSQLRKLGSRRVYLKDGTWYWNLKPGAEINEPIEI